MAGFTTPPSFVGSSRDHNSIEIEILLVEEMGVPGENIVLSTPWHEHGSNLQL
jgi:hypothetical protein